MQAAVAQGMPTSSSGFTIDTRRNKYASICTSITLNSLMQCGIYMKNLAFRILPIIGTACTNTTNCVNCKLLSNLADSKLRYAIMMPQPMLLPIPRNNIRVFHPNSFSVQEESYMEILQQFIQASTYKRFITHSLINKLISL